MHGQYAWRCPVWRTSSRRDSQAHLRKVHLSNSLSGHARTLLFLIAHCLGEPLKKTAYALAFSFTLLPAIAVAQEGSTGIAPVSPVATLDPVAQSGVLRAGVEVPLITREELTTKKKKLRVGQRFQMEVSANVSSGGVVVIPAGTPAVGEVTEVRNKGMWGKSGYIGARVISMRVGDRNVRLTGTFDDKGVTGTGGVVAAIAFVPIAGFLTTGTSAFIASGSAVKGFLDEDLSFRAAGGQPSPAPAAAHTANR